MLCHAFASRVRLWFVGLMRSVVRLICWILLSLGILPPPMPGAQPAPALVTVQASSLSLQGVECETEGRQGLVLHLGLSESVSLEQLRKHLAFRPELAHMRAEFDPQRDGGYKIYGDFLPERDYAVTVTPGLQEPSGGAVLQRALTTTFKTPKIPRSIVFNQEGKYYFPRKNGPGLELETRDISRVTLTLSRLFPNNVAVALDQINGGDGTYDFSKDWCEELKSDELKINAPGYVLAKTPVDLSKYLAREARGVFFFSAIEKKTGPAEEDGEGDGEDYEYSYQHRAGKIVIQTNLGLLAHWRERELVLFAHDLTTLKPAIAAKVSVWSNKNQLLGETMAGMDGVAVFRNFKTALGTPKVAVVEHFGDFSFLELKPRQEDAQQQDGSLDPYDPEGYEAFVYADRELYRPGETAHLRWLVRRGSGDAATSIPLVLSVIKPNGKSLLTRTTVLSGLGTGGLDLPTQRVYPTGTYSVQLMMPGSDRKVIGHYTFFLEDFVPARMKATVTMAEDRLLARRDYDITVKGEHLFGGGASDRMAEAVVYAQGSADFAPDKWKGFHFGNEQTFTPEKISLGQHPTDKEGNAAFRFNWQPQAGVTYPVRASVVGKVYELGGRAVSARKSVTLFPSTLCLGVSAVPTGKARQVAVSVAGVGPDGGLTSATQVAVTLEQQVWNYTIRRYTSNWESNWSRSFREVLTQTVKLKDGTGTTSFTVGGYGYFRVRVHSDATPQYSTQTFYCWGDEVELIDPSRPSLIKVTPAKESYQVGETAELRVEAPFNGRAFVVLQGNKFEAHYEADITSNVARIRFKVKPEYFPCVWAQVTAVHSIARQPMLISPFSSFGQAPVRVIDPTRNLKVGFPALPVETRPARAVSFAVEILDNTGKPVPRAELTLAAVDEGIHITTGYKNPDPWGWLTRLRRPTLNRNHYYDKIAYNFDKAAPGGDEEAMGKRLAQPGENWIKPLALWSGPVTTDASGRTTVTFTLPEFAGQLRLVAVACTTHSLGAGAGSIFVRRPVMLQTSQPRFMLPGDLYRGEAVLYNRTAAACKARLTWSADGALSATRGQAEIDVPAGGEANKLVDFKAGRAVGQGNVHWEAVFLDPSGKEMDRIRQEMPLPVNPPAAYQSQNEFFMLKAGESRELKNTQFVEGPNTELALTAGADMQLRLQNGLAWVIKYPYGCVEQTTSRLFPLYLLRRATAVTSAALAETGQSIDQIIRAGVDRLFSMQTADGGLAFWPGGAQPYPYGSVYALHCLTVMKNDRQVEIPAENFAALQRYVRKVAKMQEQNTWYFDNLFLRAYAVSVLAMGGDLEGLGMITNFDTITMPRPARYLLAVALAENLKDLDRVKKYLAEAPMKEWNDRELDSCLSSPIRNAAIEMLAMEKIPGLATPAELNARARQLIDWIGALHYHTTQETAFVISALAGYLSGQQGDMSQAAFTVVRADGTTATLKGAQVWNGEARGAGKRFRVINTGKAEVAVNFTTRGLPLKAEDKAITQGIQISRAFLSSSNVVTTSGQVRLVQTESPIVRLTMNVTGANELKNVIVADLLPAGLEIENPRLSPDAAPGQMMKDAVTPEHLELRDDRLVLSFAELKPGEHHFYYIVRAVTPGKFQYPAVEAECMYDATIRGRSGLGTLEVVKGGTAGTK